MIRVLLCHILGMPLNNLFLLHLDWTGLSIVGPAAGTWGVRCLNVLPGLGKEPELTLYLYPYDYKTQLDSIISGSYEIKNAVLDQKISPEFCCLFICYFK